MKLFRAIVPACIGLALASLLVAGCNTSRTKIGDIDSHPEHFAGREVRIAGEVTQVWEMPLAIANLAVYRVNDGTGQIWVLSHNGAPMKGDRVGLKGTVEPFVRENMPALHIFGDVVEEHERKQF